MTVLPIATPQIATAEAPFWFKFIDVKSRLRATRVRKRRGEMFCSLWTPTRALFAPYHRCARRPNERLFRRQRAGGGGRHDSAMGGDFFCVYSVLSYFGSKLGAGAFLFTTRKNFERVGRFDEQLFIGEEVFLSIALKKIGRFKLLIDADSHLGEKITDALREKSSLALFLDPWC